MAAETVFTLPDSDTLSAALVSVSDEDHVVENLYPRILRGAGERCTPTTFATLWILALDDYTRGMPPVVFTVLRMHTPEYVRAVIADPQIQEEVLAAFEGAGQG